MAGPDTPKGGFLGSLRDALAAAGREEQAATGAEIGRTVKVEAARTVVPAAPVVRASADDKPADPAPVAAPATPPSAAEAARAARTPPPMADRHVEADAPPTTRVVRGGAGLRMSEDGGAARTQLVRGKQQLKRDKFHQDPVVAWLVIVGGPGLGSYRPIFEGNNTIGRSSSQRIPIDFGDDTISSEEQAYIRYDSVDRSFLFVPNLAKTNVVQVNDKKPTAAVTLGAMDVITMGRTQLVFVPFCGAEFDWSEIGEAKE